MNVYKTAKGLSVQSYGISIAATWVWAPAIFVASAIACQYGVEGLAWFVIPNVLTLIIFGFVARYAPSHGVVASDVVSDNMHQESLHKVISLTLLFCSSFVQLLGIYYLASAWLDLPRWATALAVLALSLAIIWRGGLRACIKTDIIKYFVLAIIAILLACKHVPAETFPVLKHSSVHLALSFGVPTAIGLLAAPYVDTTFWQRAFSVCKTKRPQIFCFAAFAFAVVPIAFGFIGLGQPEGWTIQAAYPTIAGRLLLALAVLAALVSTVDSNLCAIGATFFNSRRAIVIFAALVFMAFVTFTRLTIIDMFLFYGTLRTVAAVPTVMTIFKKADPIKLYHATLAAAIVCPLGFALFKFFGYDDSAVGFTIAALIIPLLGWKR